MIPRHRVCTRCVMDTSDREITFDAEGRCNHCAALLSLLAQRGGSQVRGVSGVPAVVDRMRADGRGRDYDCVLGLSGGADSAYAAHAAVSLGLRVLAVHLDNGWDTTLSLRNVKAVVDRLDLGYESVVLDWEEFRDLQLAFLRASVPEIETPTDIAIPAALHTVAAKHGIKHILLGGNTQTEGILPRSWHYDPRDYRYLDAIHRRFGTRRLERFPRFDYKREIYDKLARRIRFVYLLEHIPYSTELAAGVLEKLGWRRLSGKHHESTITRFVQSYVLPTKFGLDYRRATLSTRICSGEITREAALRILETPPFDTERLAEDKRWIAKKFAITERELDAIIAAPPRSYRDYPNNERFLQLLYRTYRAVFRRKASESPLPDRTSGPSPAAASAAPPRYSVIRTGTKVTPKHNGTEG
jgi:N-acetyl sugar amidotransferase